MDGNLCDSLQLCFQEKDGKFWLRIAEVIKKNTPPNIHVTYTKSGKLDKRIMREWVEECLRVTEKSVLLLDSWSGQQDNTSVWFQKIGKDSRSFSPPPQTRHKKKPKKIKKLNKLTTRFLFKLKINSH